MSRLAVLGAGAFGTALALSFARAGKPTILWARDADAALDMTISGQTSRRLPGHVLPEELVVTSHLTDISAEIGLLAVPMAALPDLLGHPDFPPLPYLVTCMKGLDTKSGQTATLIVQSRLPQSTVAALTGPSFAVDIAAGLPTALSLACASDNAGAFLQAELSTQNLRLYRTTDVLGAELGGALKNVIAIAAGVASGAGLGDSARAAIIARGMAEMTRLADALGAEVATFGGLSGLGDLVLTATSPKSRNFSAGEALGRRQPLPDVTIEGIETSHAVNALAARLGIETPIASTISQLIRKETTVETAVAALLSRPLKKE